MNVIAIISIHEHIHERICVHQCREYLLYKYAYLQCQMLWYLYINTYQYKRMCMHSYRYSNEHLYARVEKINSRKDQLHNYTSLYRVRDSWHMSFIWEISWSFHSKRINQWEDSECVHVLHLFRRLKSLFEEANIYRYAWRLILSWICVTQNHSMCEFSDLCLFWRSISLFSDDNMGWLQWVGCLKIQVSLQNTGLFCRALLQKRPIFLSILLIVATP